MFVGWRFELCGLGPPGVGGDSEGQDVPGLPSYLASER